jgi:hypothetical protein
LSTSGRPDRSARPNLKLYDATFASFTVEVPPRFNPVLDIVERWAEEDPDALEIGARAGRNCP